MRWIGRALVRWIQEEMEMRRRQSSEKARLPQLLLQKVLRQKL